MTLQVSPFAFENKRAVLATMHGKERVVAPLLEGALGLRVRVPTRFDTDRFGTFSREITRTGTQLDAARAKIAAAFELDHSARIGVASEGSFGPHPYIPFVPLGREILVLIDRETGFELIGHHASLSTNSAHVLAGCVADAMKFADRIGCPRHGLIVMGASGGPPAPEHLLVKTIETADQLQRSVEQAIGRCGAAFIEADMRAHRNPARMRAIKCATLNLVRRYRSHCPECHQPGFWIIERLKGSPCSWCGEPTNASRAEVMACASCGHRIERPVEEATADPGQCADCNP